jgi:hypothetical protein
MNYQMQKKVVITILIILILGIIAVMTYDLFYSETKKENPYALETEFVTKSASEQICYRELENIEIEDPEPSGIAIDQYDNKVVIGKKATIYNKENRKTGSFESNSPGLCVSISKQSEILIGTETGIEVWSLRGDFLRKWRCDAEKSYPTGIEVIDSLVFLANAAERVVHKYSLNGEYLGDIAEKDSSKGIPAIIIRSRFFDITKGRQDELWVVNPGKYSIQAFDKNGNLKSTWGEYSEDIHGFCGCCNPTNIAVLSDGSFVTSEKSIPRIKIYNQAGEFECIVAGPESFNKGTKGLDIAIDSENKVYILDPSRKQIRIFEKLSK